MCKFVRQKDNKFIMFFEYVVYRAQGISVSCARFIYMPKDGRFLVRVLFA